MTPRLFVLLFVAGLLVLGILAIACGDDGGENDEDAIRDTLQAVTDACNAGDSVRVQELETSALPGCSSVGTEEPGGSHRPDEVEILSVTIEGDQAQVDTIHFHNGEPENGEPEIEYLIFRKEDGSWLFHGVGRLP